MIYKAFLWVSHGATVSSNNNYYPIETKFQFLTYYTKPRAEITTDELAKIGENPCELLLGSCPVIPITDKQSGTKEVYLPPIVFMVRDDRLAEFFGLYLFVIERSDESNECSFISSEKIIDYAALKTVHGDDNLFTYSTIFKYVVDACAARKIPPEEVSLGIFSCQTMYRNYANDPTAIRSFAPQHAPAIQTRAVIYSTRTIPSNQWINVHVMPFLPTQNPLKQWKALATLQTQGCALNVLSYFDIIPQSEARNRAVCLSIKGTSIFTIVDYLYQYMSTQSLGLDMSALTGFIIIRMPIKRAIQAITAQLHHSKQGGFVIVKMYASLRHKDKPSHVGHSVAIFKYRDMYYYTDPQASVLTHVTTAEQMFSLVPSHFTVMDVVHSVYNNPEYAFIPSNTPLDADMLIIDPDAAIKHGGGRKRTRTPSTRTPRTSRSSTKKRSRAASLDAFESLMLRIDRKNRIPPAIVIA